MKTLKFTVRFSNYNMLHDQHEYHVQCVGYDGAYDKPSMSAFTISALDNLTNFSKISDHQDQSSSVEYIVSRITDEKGRKSFASEFWKAIEHGFSEYKYAHYGFDFTITQGLNDSSDFKFLKIYKIFTNYIKNVNGSPYDKLCSSDLSAVISAAKKEWFNNADMDDFSYPTQLNVDRLFDTEDKKTLLYIELDYSGHWYDATTWESGEEIKRFFSTDAQELKLHIEKLEKDIRMIFESEWESIYYDGQVINYEDYQAILNAKN